MGFIPIESKALAKRSLNEETCKKFSYGVGFYSGRPVQVACYHDEDGNPSAQHIRFPNKEFIWIGDVKGSMLWGQHLWKDGGKQVVVTEGEIDAMSISQLQQNKWPVVSIKSGAAGAKKDIAKAVEWLEKFESVIFAFDMDAPGKKAMIECAGVLSPGRAKVWNIPLKDANEMVLAGREKELINAIWQAKSFRPDGIVSAVDIWDLVIAEDQQPHAQYPWAALNEKTHGLRVGEIVTITAGTGIGKSQVCREIASHLMARGEQVGYIALEESVQRSIRGLVAIELDQPIHIPAVRRRVPEPVLREAWDRVKDRVYFYDHWGSTDSDNLLNKIRYLVRGCGCQWIVLDHLSIIISGDAEGEERRNIDNTMTALRGLVEELKCGLLLVSHLKRPEGKGHEEGAATSLSQLRGSASIGQLSDIVIGAERNQQDVEEGNILRLRVLKNRFTGETGLAGSLTYSKETGRLRELIDNPFIEPYHQESEEGRTTHDNSHIHAGRGPQGLGVADF